jgi:hypothetical protein
VPGDIFQRLSDKKAWLEEGGNEYKDGKGPDDADSAHPGFGVGRDCRPLTNVSSQ